MLIRLTLAANKDTFYMRAKDVRTIEKDPKDRVTTLVSTDIFTPQGPLAYRVLEGIDEIAQMVDGSLGIPTGRVVS